MDEGRYFQKRACSRLVLGAVFGHSVPMLLSGSGSAGRLRRGFAQVCASAIVLLGGSVGQSAPAGSGDYLIDVWTSENGLPNSSVTSIAQTPDGYLWVGTYNGLAGFDGVRFVKFDPDNTPQLKRARVRKLYVDESGTLWINTYDGSLTSYRDGDFTLEWMGDGSF